MLPAQSIRDAPDLLIVASGVAVIFFSGELVDGIEYDMGVDVFPVCMDADDRLVSRQMLPRKFLCDLQCQFR